LLLSHRLALDIWALRGRGHDERGSGSDVARSRHSAAMDGVRETRVEEAAFVCIGGGLWPHRRPACWIQSLSIWPATERRAVGPFAARADSETVRRSFGGPVGISQWRPARIRHATHSDYPFGRCVDRFPSGVAKGRSQRSTGSLGADYSHRSLCWLCSVVL